MNAELNPNLIAEIETIKMPAPARHFIIFHQRHEGEFVIVQNAVQYDYYLPADVTEAVLWNDDGSLTSLIPPQYLNPRDEYKHGPLDLAPFCERIVTPQ